MKYVAKHHIPIDGVMFTPGEIIDKPIPEDKLGRLLKLGAVAAMPAWGELGNAVARNPRRDSENEMEASAENLPEEAEEEVPIEIDPMDGIIDADDEQETPAKESTRGRKKP